VKSKANKRIELPQVNPGNVRKMLAKVYRAKRQQVISPDWLEDQGISQPNQTLFMLQFLGLLDDKDRLHETLVADGTGVAYFSGQVRESAIGAYASAGLGDPGDLAWLGRDEINRKEIERRVAGRGPFLGENLKQGGHRNAFYCLRAVHELLVDHRWLNEPGDSGEAHAFRTSNDGDDRRNALPEHRVVEARVAHPQAARDFLQQEFFDLASGEEQPQDEGCIRVPVGTDDRGRPVMARIYLESPLKPGYLVQLGRLLQAMAQGMGAGES
jgi:hypothetical protein